MPKPKITCITPTTRSTGIALVERSLKQQTVSKDLWEWIVIAPASVSVKGIKTITTLLSDPPKQEGDYFTLYKAYNKAVRHAKGELLISWQDNTFCRPDALEKLLFHYEQEPKTLVTGVGNKYTDDTWTVETWRDPRMRSDQGSYYGCYPADIEWNLCSVPKAALYAVGGFDEYLDKYSSICGLDVTARLALLGGWDYKLDQTIQHYSLEHGRMDGWEENLPFNGPWEDRLEEYKVNPVLHYLQ